MSDDWEEDDFEVPVIAPSLKPQKAWDDEDETVIETPVATPSAATIEAAAKKKQEEELKLANALKFAALEEETPEERKVRERKQVEDADNELTGELFGGKSSDPSNPKSSSSLTAGIAGTNLKSRDDHKSFGIICAKKLSDSTAFNITAFYKSLTEKIEPKLSFDTVDEIITLLNRIKEDKRKLAEPAKVAVQKKSKSQVKAETKKHNDIFGGDDYIDPYNASYGASKFTNNVFVCIFKQ